MTQMAEKTSPDVPPNCAVVPKCKTQSDETCQAAFFDCFISDAVSS